MEITKETFKKLILLSVLLVPVTIGIEGLPIFSDYEKLEQILHQGYLTQLISTEVWLIVGLSLVLIFLINMLLLYLFKPISRPICLVLTVLVSLFMMLSGDSIAYGISEPLNRIGSFLDLFILYLIYLTPLKKEFHK